MNKNNGTWSDLPFRDKFGFIASGACFAVGMILTFLGLFLPPPGVIDSTVLTGTGEFLAAASLFGGFTSYVHSIAKDIDFRLSKVEQKEQ